MTTIFNTPQNPETLYALPPQSSEREFHDGLVGPAEIAQLLSKSRSPGYTNAPAAEELNACPISSSANTSLLLKKKYWSGFIDQGRNYWLPEVLPTVKYSTKKNYQYILRVHVYPALGDMQLRLINRDVVQDFISAKLRSGLSWRTAKSIRTALGTLMGGAEMAELIPSNPVRKTRFPRRGPTKPGPKLLLRRFWSCLRP